VTCAKETIECGEKRYGVFFWDLGKKEFSDTTISVRKAAVPRGDAHPAKGEKSMAVNLFSYPECGKRKAGSLLTPNFWGGS